MRAVQKTSRELCHSDHQVCFGDNAVRPAPPELICFPFSEKFQLRFTPNTVKNQKYNAFTFLPIVFYEQFKFFFNLYFLLVALSQFIPALKIGLYSYPYFSLSRDLFTMGITGFIVTYIAPLAFVLFVTMGKEAYDDYKRYLRDKEANSAKYLILEPSGADTAPLDGGPHTRSVPSSSIRVGDLILLEKNQRVPADLVLLRTSDSSGTCFIRTDQLDGETDWKLRAAVPTCQKLHSDRDLLSLDAEIYGMYPPLLYSIPDIELCMCSRSSNKRYPYFCWNLHH